ncbi:protein of unknown function [Paraburkholderia kururiensis]
MAGVGRVGLCDRRGLLAERRSAHGLILPAPGAARAPTDQKKVGGAMFAHGWPCAGRAPFLRCYARKGDT